MRGSIFYKTLPKEAGPRRERMLLDAVRRLDLAPIAWVPITTSIEQPGGGKYTAKILVSKDALRAGDATDSFRFSVNHRTAQHMADALGCVLPTPFLSDQIYKQAPIKLSSWKQTRPWHADGTMADTDRMLQQSEFVDRLIARKMAETGKNGLIADVGKDWVTSPELWQPYAPSPRCEKGHPRAQNYGWHYAPDQNQQGQFYAAITPGLRVIQPAARCHTIGHVDYSQIVRLVRRDVDVCGIGPGGGCIKMDIRQLATSPQLARLVSASGVLPAMRHPDVPPSCDNRCPEPVEPRFAKSSTVERCPPGQILTSQGCEAFIPAGPCPGDQVMTERGCVEPVRESTSPVAYDPPPEAGPLSCPIGCDELPEIQPDPTVAYELADLSTPDKLVMIGAGGVLGFLAVNYLLPKL